MFQGVLAYVQFQTIFILHADKVANKVVINKRPKYLKNILSLTTICRGGGRGGLEKIHSMGRYMYGYFLELQNSCFIYTSVFIVGFDFKFYSPSGTFAVLGRGLLRLVFTSNGVGVVVGVVRDLMM